MKTKFRLCCHFIQCYKWQKKMLQTKVPLPVTITFPSSCLPHCLYCLLGPLVNPFLSYHQNYSERWPINHIKSSGQFAIFTSEPRQPTLTVTPIAFRQFLFLTSHHGVLGFSPYLPDHSLSFITRSSLTSWCWSVPGPLCLLFIFQEQQGRESTVSQDKIII